MVCPDCNGGGEVLVVMAGYAEFETCPGCGGAGAVRNGVRPDDRDDVDD